MMNMTLMQRSQEPVRGRRQGSRVRVERGGSARSERR